jgi:ribosomal-protein-alanine N-acetyltransferase
MELLHSKRTILRRFQLSDLENMIRLESDPEVMKFTPSRVPQAVEKTEARLKTLVAKEASYAPLGVWVVELNDSAEFVGWFMLIKTEFEVPEIGFMIVKDQWSKGFATEVAQVLIDFGMKELRYPGIAAVTDHNNAASIHILEKLGFQKVGSRIKADKVLERDVEGYIFELRR